MFGKAGLGGLMQQAQKMQENMKKAQAELAVTELIAEAAEDKEMLEDLVLAAVNAAHEAAEQLTSATMGKFTQGLPAGIGDFFK